MPDGSDVPDFYFNSVRLAFRPSDILVEVGIETAEFVVKGEAVEVTQGPYRTLARLRTSPQEALILSKVLAGALQEYERQFGKIPEAPGQILEPTGAQKP